MMIGYARRMRIPNEALARLTDAGLLVSDPFVENHVGYPDGVAVAKPTSVSGNSMPGYDAGWGTAEIHLDAPVLHLHGNRGCWVVTSHDYVPGPGPGDFVNEHGLIKDAVDDILDFFLGNPDRMQTKIDAEKPPDLGRQPERCMWRACEKKPAPGIVFCEEHRL